jgi:hypothetical protein
MEAALENLHEVEDLLKGFPGNGNIPAVELDLALQKLRNLYELLLMMKKSPAMPETIPAPVATAVVPPSVVPVADTSEPAPAATAPAAPPVPKEAQILSDRFKDRTTLHETLHHNVGKEATILSQAKPIGHLMAAIGINDRFTFIRELFNNDNVAFEHTIQTLNEAANFNDAYNYMIQHFDWDMDSEAVQQLLEIIRRKFIKSRHE